MAQEVSITRPSRTVVLKSAHSGVRIGDEIPNLFAILGIRIVLGDDVDVLLALISSSDQPSVRSHSRFTRWKFFRSTKLIITGM